MSLDRAVRHLGRPTRRENPCTVLPEREGEHAIEVHFVETGRRDMTQDGCVDLAFAVLSPAIERGLHLMGVPGHDKVRDERERTGLGTQLFCTVSVTATNATMNLAPRHWIALRRDVVQSNDCHVSTHGQR